jgi:hypothetical protein
LWFWLRWVQDDAPTKQGKSGAAVHLAFVIISGATQHSMTDQETYGLFLREPKDARRLQVTSQATAGGCSTRAGNGFGEGDPQRAALILDARPQR